VVHWSKRRPHRPKLFVGWSRARGWSSVNVLNDCLGSDQKNAGGFVCVVTSSVAMVFSEASFDPRLARVGLCELLPSEGSVHRAAAARALRLGLRSRLFARV
jgi:hypothetical protein